MPFLYTRIVWVLFTLITSIVHAQNSTVAQISEKAIIYQIKEPLFADKLSISAQFKASSDFITLLKLGLSGGANGKDFANRALQVAVETKDSLNIGLSYMALLKYSTSANAIDNYLNLANRIFDSRNFTNLKMLCNLHAAPEFSKIGANYVKAFRLTNLFLENYTIKEDSLSYARAWNTLGEIYRNLKNNPKALMCYQKAAPYCFFNDQLLYTSPYINMGTIYKNSGNYDSAFFYFNMVLSANTSRNGSMYAYILNRKAQTYQLMAKYDSAYEHAQRSLALYETIDMKEGIVLASSTLSRLQFNLGRLEECVKSGKRALNISAQIKYYPQELLEPCELLISILEKQGHYDEAFSYQKKYNTIYTKLYDPEVNIQMLNEQLALEIRNQHLETSLLKERQSQTEIDAKNQLIILILILITLLMAGIALALLFKKNNKLASVNKKLFSLIDENSGLINTIVHDLKSPLNSLQGLLTVIQNETKENKNASEYIKHGFRVLKGGHEIIQQLIELRSLEERSYKFKTESIEIQQFLENIKQDFDIAAKEKVIELKTQSESVTISTDQTLLRRVLENLVSNAVKFSPEGKQVNIKSWVQKDQVYFEVSDQGPGFHPDDMDRIYGKFQKLSARPTGGESSNGLGLATVNLLIKELKGTIQLKTAVNQGARFTLGIPSFHSA